MNLLASLVEAEERIAQLGDRIRRQEAIILRLHQVHALPCVIRTAEELHRALTDTMLAALERRDGFAAALEKYPLDGVLGTMQVGLSVPFWTVEDLAEMAPLLGTPPPQWRLHIPAKKDPSPSSGESPSLLRSSASILGADG